MKLFFIFFCMFPVLSFAEEVRFGYDLGVPINQFQKFKNLNFKQTLYQIASEGVEILGNPDKKATDTAFIEDIETVPEKYIRGDAFDALPEDFKPGKKNDAGAPSVALFIGPGVHILPAINQAWAKTAQPTIVLGNLSTKLDVIHEYCHFHVYQNRIKGQKKVEIDGVSYFEEEIRLRLEFRRLRDEYLRYSSQDGYGPSHSDYEMAEKILGELLLKSLERKLRFVREELFCSETTYLLSQDWQILTPKTKHSIYCQYLTNFQLIEENYSKYIAPFADEVSTYRREHRKITDSGEWVRSPFEIWMLGFEGELYSLEAEYGFQSNWSSLSMKEKMNIVYKETLELEKQLGIKPLTLR